MVKKALLVVAMLALLVTPAFAQRGYTQKQITFANDYSLSTPCTDIAWVKIYNLGTETASTIKGDRGGAVAVTNPITRTSTNSTLNASLGLVTWFSTAEKCDVEASVGGVIVRITDVRSVDTRIIVPKTTAPRTTWAKGGFVKQFGEQPVCVQEDGTAASGVDTEVNLALMHGLVFEFQNINTQTILVPNIAATGLDIAKDLTDTDGLELTQGIVASSPAAFTVGTDGAFHFLARVYLTDVSGTDDFLIGFRKAEAYQAAVDNYDEMAALNIISGDITIETILNAGATTSTDTTDNWADTTSKTVGVHVSAAGVVTYTIDGVAPTTTAAFTFDDAEVVVPFIYFIHDGDVAEATILQRWDCGLDN